MTRGAVISSNTTERQSRLCSKNRWYVIIASVIWAIMICVCPYKMQTFYLCVSTAWEIKMNESKQDHHFQIDYNIFFTLI